MSSKKFTLKMAVDDIPDGEVFPSPDEVHFGVRWALLLDHCGEEFGCFLRCLKEKDLEKPWSIHVTFEMRLVSAKRGVTNKSERSYTFDECVGYGWGDFASWEEATQDTTTDNPTMVYCDVTIKKMTGIALKRHRSFEEPEEHLTDAILKIREEKFHVAKVVLATQSPFFKKLFFGDFDEKNKLEIELKEVDADIFQSFLEIIYWKCEITAEKVEGLLELGDKFDTQLVRDRCEEFLLESKAVGNEKKLRMADAYNLKILMKNCLDSIQTSAALKTCLPIDLAEFSHSTTRALLEKFLSFS